MKSRLSSTPVTHHESRPQTNEALRAHHQDLTTQARERHDVLTAAIETLDHALARAATHRERSWSEHAANALDHVRQAIQMHADGVQEPEGLFDEITAVEPRLEARVSALRREHFSLKTRASALAEGLASQHALGVADLRREAAALLSDLRAHRAAESDLVYEAFWMELGAAD